MTLAAPSVNEIDAELCRRSLKNYIAECWPLVEAGRSFQPNWHIDAICEHLEAVSEREIRRLIVNIPPRHMKSLAVSVFWPTWVWLRDPRSRWLFASYTQPLATRDAVRARRILQSEGVRGSTEGTLLQRVGYRGLLELLHEDWELMVDQNVKTRYDNDRTGYRLSASFNGSVTGDGGDYRVVDDPHKPDEVVSDQVRGEELRWFDEVWSNRGMEPKSDVQVVIMQRLHEQDLTGHLLEKGGWEHLCLPAEYEPTHPFTWPDDPRTEPGDLIWPQRMDAGFLAQQRVDLGSYGYAGQYQQRPSPEEGGILKRDWWRFYEPYRWPECKELVASWDCAFKDTDGSDWVVGQLWLRDLADKYLLCQVRARLDFPATVEAVQALRKWADDNLGMSHRIFIEEAANGAAVISTLKRRVPGIVPVKPMGSKEARVHAAAPQVEAGNVYLPQGIIPAPRGYDPTPTESFIDEAAGFPSAAHDDQVDALSQALNQIDRRASKPRVRAGGYDEGRLADR